MPFCGLNNFTSPSLGLPFLRLNSPSLLSHCSHKRFFVTSLLISFGQLSKYSIFFLSKESIHRMNLRCGKTMGFYNSFVIFLVVFFSQFLLPNICFPFRILSMEQISSVMHLGPKSFFLSDNETIMLCY